MKNEEPNQSASGMSDADHRVIGKQLELFHFDETAPGMPYWLPKGLRLFNELINFWRADHDERGYQEIATPLVNEKRLWEISGHWEHYRDNMFVIPVSEHVTYALKAMNCPNAMVVFNLRPRSYRELPLRFSDCDPLHRHEASGALHGLMRVQKFQQDDAHIFLAPAQIEQECDSILAIAAHFYGLFAMKYRFRLGTRPAQGFIGDIETWDRAEEALQRVLDKHVGNGKYVVGKGEGAFYGPKIDILIDDALGREWQLGTVQLDFQLPGPDRFNCRYIDRDSVLKHPVVIHRAIYGSLERFIGILIEHCRGAFPVWLSPVQAKIIPIADRHIAYAEDVARKLRAARLRVELDDSSERMNNKIRRAQMEKVPYMLVVGDREVERNQVAVRLRSEENLGAMSVEDFLLRACKVVAEKSGI